MPVNSETCPYLNIYRKTSRQAESAGEAFRCDALTEFGVFRPDDAHRNTYCLTSGHVRCLRYRMAPPPLEAGASPLVEPAAAPPRTTSRLAEVLGNIEAEPDLAQAAQALFSDPHPEPPQAPSQETEEPEPALPPSKADRPGRRFSLLRLARPRLSRRILALLIAIPLLILLGWALLRFVLQPAGPAVVDNPARPVETALLIETAGPAALAVASSPTPSATAQLPTPTPTVEPSATPTTAPSNTPSATPVPPSATPTVESSPTATATPTSPPTATPFAVVRYDDVVIRAGPGRTYRWAGAANAAASYPVAGQNEAGDWIRLAGSKERWISAELLDVSDDLPILPAPTATPSPSPTPTATASATPTARPTPSATPTPDPNATPTPAATPTPRGPGLVTGTILFMSDRLGQPQLLALAGQCVDNWPDACRDEPAVPVADLAFYEQTGQAHLLSPDGQYRLLVGPNERGVTQVSVRNVLYGLENGLTFFENGIAYDPVWSPRGDLIALVSNDPGNDEIYTFTSDGQHNQRLTFNQTPDKHPTWSPDGRRILFETAGEDGRRQLWIMNADGSDQRNISQNDANDWAPVWIK